MGTREKVRRKRLPVEILTPEEVHSLMSACGTTPIGIRHRALIAVMYRAGLRISEALDLYPKDVDLERGAIRVLSGKGGYARTVGIDQGGIAHLRHWIDLRPRFDLDGRHPLLSALSGGRLTEAYIRRLMPRLAKKARIPKRVHAHGLRHTHAAELRSEGIDIGIISKQLGHRSIATTARYLDHIAPYAVVEAMRGRDWTSAVST